MATCLSSTMRTYYQARLDKLLAQLALIDDAIDNAIPNSEVESYKFDDNAGSQQVKRRSGESLEKWRMRIEASIDRYRRKLDGTGLINLRLLR